MNLALYFVALAEKTFLLPDVALLAFCRWPGPKKATLRKLPPCFAETS